MGMLKTLGRGVINRIKTFFYTAGFFFNVLLETWRIKEHKQVGYKVLIMQILFTGFEALGIISLISISLGAVIIIQGVSLLPKFGQGDLIYSILVAVITRELGPILTAFIINARSGTAIATELGTMVVNHEIEAYISVGINPISYLVVPRFLGVIIAQLILNVYFNIFGLVGSYFLAQLVNPIPASEYFYNLLLNLKLVDIISSLIKSLAFGVITSIVATYHGFSVKRASTEVPQVAIKAVGQGFVFCIIANVIISLIYYL